MAFGRGYARIAIAVRWTRTEVKRGWLLRDDRRTTIRKARGFKAPWNGRCSSECRAPLGL